jgi:hypothetical protein
MDFINGFTRVLYIKVSTTFIPIGCLTENSLSEELDLIPSTTRESNGWETSRPTNQRYNIEFSGMSINTAFTGGDPTLLSYDRLKNIKRTRVLFDWKVASNDGLFVDTGKGYLNSLSEAAPAEGFITFSGNITGFGEPTFNSDLASYVFQDANNFIFTDSNNFSF